MMSLERITNTTDIPDDSVVLLLRYSEYQVAAVLTWINVSLELPQAIFVVIKDPASRIELYNNSRLVATYPVDLSESELYDVVTRAIAKNYNQQAVTGS